MKYDSYSIDNDMWYKKRKHIYHLMGDIKNCEYNMQMSIYLEQIY